MRIWQLPALDVDLLNLIAATTFFVVCLNPFIYASRYEVFRRQLKHMMNTSIVTASTTG